MTSVNVHCRQRKVWKKGKCVFGGKSRSVPVCHRSGAIVVLWPLSPPIYSVSLATTFVDCLVTKANHLSRKILEGLVSVVCRGPKEKSKIE